MRNGIVQFLSVSTLSLAVCTNVVLASGQEPGEECTYFLTASSGQPGSARVDIEDDEIKVKFESTNADTLYTVWVDHKNRATGLLADDYPIAQGALGRGVAPAFASNAGVTSGVGLDQNGIITDDEGDAILKVKLDYNILQPGTSPVVGAELAMQGLNRVGGGWLRTYVEDPASMASAQVPDPTDPSGTTPLLPRSTPQGITVVRHADRITHGHTPGVGGVDHFSAFKGDFPSGCLP